MHYYWVLLELEQVRRPGAGNVSLPRLRPGAENDRPVEFATRYLCDKSTVTGDLRLMVFSEADFAYGFIGEAAAEGKDVAVIEVSGKDLLHRVFRGDKNGLCVLDPVPLSAMIGGYAEHHHMITPSVTIGELVDGTVESLLVEELKALGEWN